MTLQQLRYVIAIEKYGSFSKAAKSLFVSQPSVSALVKDLEAELDIIIFNRDSKGISLSAQGKEFLKYANQFINQSDYIVDYFKHHKRNKPALFSISSQHYSFVISAFLAFQKEVASDRYALRLKETQTSTVIEDVAGQRSEIGIIFTSEFSEKYICKLLKNNNLFFHPLVETPSHAFVYKKHPLAKHKSLKLKDLEEYPCIIYDQNENQPLYLAEELTIPAYYPSKILYSSDLFSSCHMMRSCNAYNIGSGIMTSSGLEDFVAIPVDDLEPMCIGWISLQNSSQSELCKLFIEELQRIIKNRP